MSVVAQLPDFMTDADLTGTWWWRLRRSFAIPDLARDETAFVAITEEVGHQVQGTPDYEPAPVAEAVVTAFLKAGQAGDLEDLLVPDRVAGKLVPSNMSLDVASRITQSATKISGVRGQLAGDNAVMWSDIAGFMLERFTEHLRRLPHEDKSGLYFAN